MSEWASNGEGATLGTPGVSEFLGFCDVFSPNEVEAMHLTGAASADAFGLGRGVGERVTDEQPYERGGQAAEPTRAGQHGESHRGQPGA